jgi:hypothetical protein
MRTRARARAASAASAAACLAVRRGAFSKSVDVYALGCVLAETWGGAVPFDGVEPAEIRRRVLAGERPQVTAPPRRGARRAGARGCVEGDGLSG